MRKPTKRWKICDVSVNIVGASYPMFVDPDSGEFWSRVGNVVVSGKTKDDARALIRQKAIELGGIDQGWEQVIVVAPPARKYSTVHLHELYKVTKAPEVSFAHTYLWLRTNQDGKKQTRDWKRIEEGDLGFERQKFGDDIKPIIGPIINEGEVILAYNKELFWSLEQLATQLLAINRAFRKVIARDDFVERLLAGDTNLLEPQD